MQRLTELVRDLRDRRVFRIASVYAVTAWILVQVAAVVFPAFELPNWTMRLVVILAVLGFPVAIVLGWAYQLTPEGLVRDADGSARAPGRRVDFVIIGALLVLVVFLAFRDHLPGFGTTEVAPAISPHSIAVLPFVNMNDVASTEYFSDGITEELLNVLAQIPDLEVASRTSSFAFKNSDATIPIVAEQLGVAYVLEGSVRRDEDRVRITAQLIDGATDKHVWSRTYDRELKDIFAIQDEIAGVVAGQLQLTLFAARGLKRPTSDLQAYDLYLKGLALSHGPETAVLEESIGYLRQSIALDPGFERAQQALARTRQRLAEQ